MATGIDQAIVLQYSSQFDYQFQQRIPRLRRFVRVKTDVVGSQTQFPVLNESQMEDITGKQHAVTNWIDPQVIARWAAKQDKTHPVMLDWQDRLEILIDLESGYAANGAMAAARTADQIIVAAVQGTAYQGANGTVSSAFNTTAITSATARTTLGNVLAAGGTGLTYAKVREARAILNAREVGVDDLGMRDRDAFVWVVSAGAMSQLMNEAQATSRDYIEGSPLTEGAIIYFMGFNFVIYNDLTNTTGTTYRTLVWHRDAVGYAIWKERDLRIDQLPEHNYSTGITYLCSINLEELDTVPCGSNVTVNTGINEETLVVAGQPANDDEATPYQARHVAA